MSHYTLGAHQARVSQQYISYLLLLNHIITPHYRNLLGPFQFPMHSSQISWLQIPLHVQCKISMKISMYRLSVVVFQMHEIRLSEWSHQSPVQRVQIKPSSGMIRIAHSACQNHTEWMESQCMPKSYLQSEQVKWYPYLRDIHIQSSTSTAPVYVLNCMDTQIVNSYRSQLQTRTIVGVSRYVRFSK